MRMNNELINLAKLLKDRLQIIADHEFRDKDSNAHLESLKRISEAIEAKHQSLKKTLDPRLRHYLSNMSYEKALNHIENSINN